MWAVAVIWLKYCWKRRKTPFNQHSGRTFCHFHQIRNCRLQTPLVQSSPKFVIWERVKWSICKGQSTKVGVAILRSQTAPNFFVNFSFVVKQINTGTKITGKNLSKSIDFFFWSLCLTLKLILNLSFANLLSRFISADIGFYCKCTII